MTKLATILMLLFAVVLVVTFTAPPAHGCCPAINMKTAYCKHSILSGDTTTCESHRYTYGEYNNLHQPSIRWIPWNCNSIVDIALQHCQDAQGWDGSNACPPGRGAVDENGAFHDHVLEVQQKSYAHLQKQQIEFDRAYAESLKPKKEDADEIVISCAGAGLRPAWMDVD